MACQLTILSGPRQGTVVRVAQVPFWIGRDPRCDLAFDPTRNLMVSGRHAEIIQTGDHFLVRDASTNGTFVNSMRVEQVRLRDGDEIEVGPGGPRLGVALVQQPGADPPPPPRAMAPPPTSPADGQLPPVLDQPLPGTRPMQAKDQPPLPGDGETVVEVTVALDRPDSGQRLTFTKQVIRIGRDPSADVAFDIHGHLLVSYNHAKIMVLEGQPVLFDSDSTNGTFIDGQRVSRHDLQDGQEIELGQGGPRLRVVSVTRRQVAARLTVRGQQVKGDTVFAGAAADLRDLSLGEAALLGEYPLAPRMVIGRDADSAVVLDSMFVSSRHAVIERRDGTYHLRDSGSANGTYISGERVSDALLVPGAEIVVGTYVLKFTGQDLLVFDTREKTWVDAHELSFIDQRSKRAYLDGVSLKIQPGEFVCILGPSGCGKSTLLKGLNGSRRADEGTVLMNSIDFYKNYEQLKHQVGYVPQDDIIHPQLSIWRTLHYAARLRLPPGASRAKRRERIQDVLSVLELFDHRDKPIHKLSGGQRKRVSIAVELLTDPAIIYLDEPTSGLDPNLEEKMMLLFREMTLRGKTVAAVTHTLDNIQLADKVTFLVDGKLAFFGTEDEARSFFDVQRLPEVYKRFDERRGDLDALKAEFAASPVHEQHIGSQLAPPPDEPAAPRKPAAGRRLGPGPLSQFVNLTGRYVEILTRDVRNTAILLVQAPLVALFIVLAVSTDQPDRGPSSTMFLIMSLSALWFGCSNAAREVTKESSIYARERMVNLGVLPYVASKFFVLQFLALIQVATMLAIVSALRSGFTLSEPPQACARWGIQACSMLILDGVPGSFWRHLLNLYLTALNGVGLGLLVSALAGNSDKAMSLVPLILIPQVLFSGSFGIPQSDEWVKRGVGYAMSLNWSLDQAKRIAMCTPELEKPPGRAGAGCTTCIHAHDPFKYRLLSSEQQDDDSRCAAILPVVAQMTDFPEALQVVEDGLYTPPSGHGKGPARLATRSPIGLYVQGGYALLLFILVALFMRLKDRRQ